ncbi:hypothetical protein DL771_010031 [Monosporascus sp. 5C6A]|nr:hypothetical protein DL771_010031 [Monosporascus sp. 5C6A]
MLNCDIPQPFGQPGGRFNFTAWFARGTCIHAISNYTECQNTLRQTLDNQDSLHTTEYSAGATVLALLPTVGALLGSPSAEIWMLLKILPFGGTLALLLSFVNVMIPDRLADYLGPMTILDTNGARDAVPAGPSLVVPSQEGKSIAPDIAEEVSVRIRTVMANTLMNSYIAVPFDHYVKLYITPLPKNCNVKGQSVSAQLADPRSIRANLATFVASSKAELASTSRIWFPTRLFRQRRNIVVLISKVRPTNGDGSVTPRFLAHLVIKLSGATVYMFATSVFAAVSLLALPMAQFVLMMVIGAGISGRHLTSYLAAKTGQKDSFIHVIADSEERAGQIVQRVFEDQVQAAATESSDSPLR